MAAQKYCKCGNTVKVLGGSSHLVSELKHVITPVINGISRVNPRITGVITHLLSGMNHQVQVCRPNHRTPYDLAVFVLLTIPKQRLIVMGLPQGKSRAVGRYC